MKAITAPFRWLGLIPKTPALPAPLPTPQPDDTQAAIQQEDALARRRGGAADIFSSQSGVATPTNTGKATLGS